MAHSCPLWTGIPTPLALGVAGECVPKAWLVTFVLGGLWRSGNNMLKNTLALNESAHALQALFPLCRRLLPVRGLLRSHAARDFLFFFFPLFRRTG